MESPLVSILILTLLTQMSDLACGQELNASENPAPVGNNVTLSLSNPLVINVGSWLHDSTTIVFIYPSGFTSTVPRVTFNRTSSSLFIRSLRLSDSGIYKLQCPLCGATFVIPSLTLSVQEPISDVTLTASSTNLVEFNNTAVLTCSVSAGSSLSYLWLNGSSEVTPSEGVQLGDGDSTLTMVMVTRYDQGPFRCNVSNNISSGASQPVHLNISYGPSDPKIMTMPMEVAYPTGSNITLSCHAESKPGPTVQWFFDEGNLEQSSSPLHLDNAQKNQTGTYKCLLHNTVTSRFTSVSRMIRIMDPISNVELKRVGGPVILNESFTLSCEVNVPVEHVLWLRDGEVISRTNSTVNMVTMTINRAQLSDDGEYKCEAFNAVSNKTSSPYDMLVNYGPENTSIKGPSASLTGRSVMFNCTSSSQPPSQVSWYFNDSLVGSTSEFNAGPLTLAMGGKYSCVAHNNITGKNSTTYKTLTVYAPVTMPSIKIVGSQPVLNHAFSLSCETVGSVHIYWMKDGWPLHADSRRNISMDNATLTFDPVLSSDNGFYQCDASNPLSSNRSDNFTLKVEFGPENTTITGQTVAGTGQNITFKCVASSYPPSHFKWFFNDSLVANTSEYVIGPLTPDMGGNYTCTAYNVIAGQNSTTTLTVVGPITDVQIEVPSKAAIEGHSYQMTCNVADGSVDMYILWNKNDERLHGNNRTVFSADNKTVTLNPIEHNDKGNYECVAANPVSNVTSHPYVLIVNFGPDTPVISGPSLAEIGQEVVLHCSAKSEPPSQFNWYFNGSLWFPNGSMLTIPKEDSMLGDMSGEYVCMAHNNVTGKNSSTTTMIKFIEGITSVMVKADTIPIDSHNLTLTCEVTGLYDSIYWMRNSTRLDNNCSSINSNMSFCIMNNSLHFNPVTVSEDGNYLCVATNTIRPHPSPGYSLRVNYGPLDVTITGPGSVDQGTVASVSLVCYAESRPDCEYQWFFNSQPSAHAHTATIEIIATKPNEGNYTCKAKNPVTNITMSQKKQLLINRASARPLLSPGGVMLVALLTLTVISERLTH